MTPRQRIINAFWHRTRKVFVPLTRRELSNKAHVSFLEIEQNRDLYGAPMKNDRNGANFGETGILYLTNDAKRLAHAD